MKFKSIAKNSETVKTPLPEARVEIGPCTLYHGDCLEVLKSLPDNSVDSVVTDPPAGIGFMGKSWDTPGTYGYSDGGTRTGIMPPQAEQSRNPSCKKCHGRKRAGPKTKGCTCEVPDWNQLDVRLKDRKEFIDFLREVMKEVYRVLKPGGHALVWALPRTSHWTATACEDAGFEIRDRVAHIFGTGFPKNMDVSKAIDKAAGAKRDVIGKGKGRTGEAAQPNGGSLHSDDNYQWPGDFDITAPATPEAAQWEGWGTALKPACEDWWLCRKPLEGTVAANVLKHGTGGLNIDACRVPTDETPSIDRRKGKSPERESGNWENDRRSPETFAASRVGESLGRFPANLIHDGSDEVLAGFPNSKSTGGQASLGAFRNGDVYGKGRDEIEKRDPGYGDDGSAARFFYCTKASKKDRNEGGVANKHPTVKNTELMRYLCLLITPPGGTVLDPFAGSFSTGKAAVKEGFKFIGIEAEREYFDIGVERIQHEVGKLAGV